MSENITFIMFLLNPRKLKSSAVFSNLIKEMEGLKAKPSKKAVNFLSLLKMTLFHQEIELIWPYFHRGFHAGITDVPLKCQTTEMCVAPLFLWREVVYLDFVNHTNPSSIRKHFG